MEVLLFLLSFAIFSVSSLRFSAFKSKATLRPLRSETFGFSTPAVDEPWAILDISPVESFWTFYPRYLKDLENAKLSGDMVRHAELRKAFGKFNTYAIAHGDKEKRKWKDMLLPKVDTIKSIEELIGARRNRNDLKDRLSYFPTSLQHMLAYIISLWKPPSISELGRFVGISCALAAYAAVSGGKSSKQNTFYGVGIATSQLVMRGSGMDATEKAGKETESNALINVSPTSVFTAVVLTSSVAATVYFGLYLLLSQLQALKTSPGLPATIASVAAILLCNIAAAFFEVYEPKAKDGMRWRHAVQRLEEEPLQYGSAEQVYDFDYDPDASPHPLYGPYESVPGPVEHVTVMKNPYDRDKHVPDPVEEAKVAQMLEELVELKKITVPQTPEELQEYLQHEDGFFDVEVPDFLQKALALDKERDADMFNYDPVAEMAAQEVTTFNGTAHFRDGTPEWAKHFQRPPYTDVDEMFGEMARQFGTYRRFMYKEDKKVKLGKYDVE